VTRRAPAFALAAALVLPLVGCSGTPTDPGVPANATAAPEAGVLTAGESPQALDGAVFSPVDFVPPLQVTDPQGWVSTHRGDDAFDLSLTLDGETEPAVTVAFLTPQEATAQDALATLRTRVGEGAPVKGTLGGREMTGFDVVEGEGLLVESPSGTVRLDRQPGQRARLLALDLDDVPLLVVIAVPEGRRFAALFPRIDALLRSTLPA
jgi:hypothetical protein